MPPNTAFGILANRLKSADRISNATPNITKARAKFKIQSCSVLNAIRISSMEEKVVFK